MSLSCKGSKVPFLLSDIFTLFSLPTPNAVHRKCFRRKKISRQTCCRCPLKIRVSGQVSGFYAYSLKQDYVRSFLELLYISFCTFYSRIITEIKSEVLLPFWRHFSWCFLLQQLMKRLSYLLNDCPHSIY